MRKPGCWANGPGLGLPGCRTSGCGPAQLRWGGVAGVAWQRALRALVKYLSCGVLLGLYGKSDGQKPRIRGAFIGALYPERTFSWSKDLLRGWFRSKRGSQGSLFGHSRFEGTPQEGFLTTKNPIRAVLTTKYPRGAVFDHEAAWLFDDAGMTMRVLAWLLGLQLRSRPGSRPRFWRGVLVQGVEKGVTKACPKVSAKA